MLTQLRSSHAPQGLVPNAICGDSFFINSPSKSGLVQLGSRSFSARRTRSDPQYLGFTLAGPGEPGFQPRLIIEPVRAAPKATNTPGFTLASWSVGEMPASLAVCLSQQYLRCSEVVSQSVGICLRKYNDHFCF